MGTGEYRQDDKHVMTLARNGTRIIIGILFSSFFSLLFILSSSGLISSGNLFIHIFLGLETSLGLVMGFVWWKQGTRDKKSASLLLWVLLIDYWVWIFFARFEFTSSYVFLVALEAHRFACVIQVIRSVYGHTPIGKVWNLYLLRILLVDIVLFVFHGQPRYSDNINWWYKLQFIHPLFSGTSFPAFFIGYLFFELNCTALYVVRFRAESENDQEIP